MNICCLVSSLFVLMVDKVFNATVENCDLTRQWVSKRQIQQVTQWSLVVMLSVTLIFHPFPVGAKASQDDFVVAITGDAMTFDPALAMDGTSALVATQIFDSLVAFQPGSLLPVPGLAEHWTVSGDGRTWTFYLQPGIMFQDNTPLNADAVVFNLQRWWDPSHPYHQGSFIYFQSLFHGFKGDPACLIEDVYAVDPLTVVIKLARAGSSFLSFLALPFFSIASPTAIQAGTLATLPIGTGPFRFANYLPGDQIQLSANTQYWRGAPRSQHLTFRVMPSATDRLTAVKSGTVQVADNVRGAVTDPELQVLTRTGLVLGYLGINRGHAFLDNLLVRQAIAHAVDKAHLLAVGYSEGTQSADQFLPSGLWGRDPTIVDYDYNPVLARSLLTQAGYATGITTTLSYRPVVRSYLPDPQAVAQAMQADMEVAGIHLVITEYESGPFLDKVYAGELDLFLLGWGADFPHPDNFFSPHFCPSAGFGPTDAELCNQLDIARISPNLASQEAIYQWASRRVHETLPLVPLAYTSSGLTMRFDVAGVTPSPLGYESYKEARVVGATFATIVPAEGGTLSFENVNSQTTTVLVPPNAIDQPTTFHLVEAEPNSAPDNRESVHHGFDLSASRNGVPLTGFAFTAPISVTIAYSDDELAGVWEDNLALYYWNGTAWADAATTCSPTSTYVRDPANNQISVAVCHLSQFGLFGEKWPSSYLPLVVR